MQDERFEIKMMLFRNNLTATWLISQLEKRGIITQKTELSSVLAGSRRGEKVDKILTESKAILSYYEKRMNVASDKKYGN